MTHKETMSPQFDACWEVSYEAGADPHLVMWLTLVSAALKRYQEEEFELRARLEALEKRVNTNKNNSESRS